MPGTRHPAGPSVSRFRRAVTGLTGLGGIVALLAGVPYALFRLAGNPDPGGLPGWSEIGTALTSRDDGSLFLAAITWAGWLGWASFAVPLLVEIPFQLLRRRPPRLVGLAWQQRRAAALVAAALAIAGSPAVASASAVATPTHATAAHPPATAIVQQGAAGALPTDRAPPDPGGGGGRDSGPVYSIERGDWLHHVAERYLGDGDRYRDIAALNPELKRADPRFPDHITEGQQVRLPVDARDRGPRSHATGDVLPGVPGPGRTRDPGARPAPTGPRPNESTRPAPTGPTGAEPGGPAATQGGPTARPGGSAATPGGPTAGVTAPATTPVPSATPAATPAEADGAREPEDAGLADQILPVTAVFATAGMLTALLLYQLSQRRQRQRSHRRPGRRIPQPANSTTEVRARAAARPADVTRLDQALRALAAGLRERESRPPDIAAAWLSAGDVHVVLTEPDPQPVPPFEAEQGGRSWTLTGAAPLPAVDEILAPLPALVTIASKPGGEHLLIDLERAGLLSVGGDPARGADLMRYLAAELATSQWSDDIEVVLAGFDPADTDNLLALSEDRMRIAPSVPEAIARARRRARANAAALADAGLDDALDGRVRDVSADAWMPLVLLIADVGDAADQLAALGTEIRLAGRCAVAVVAVTPTPAPWHIAVAADGTLGIDWLSVTGAVSARLPGDQLARLAALMRTARSDANQPAPPDEAVPPAPEPEPWAAGTDAHGHLITPPTEPAAASATVPPAATTLPAAGAAARPAEDATTITPPSRRSAPDQTANGGAPDWGDTERERSPAVPEPSRHGPAPDPAATAAAPVDIRTLTTAVNGVPRPRRPEPAARPQPADPDADLDRDLAAWDRPDPHRPRIAILGPVSVAAPGEPPEERQRFYAEIIVYLAQRGRSGATGEQIDDALWPERMVNARSRRVAISKARRWLGESEDGAQWLPPNAGADRCYRLTPGYLLDWHLFRRLRARGERRGPAGADDLRRALDLVRGEPLARAELPYSSGYRNPYTWLPDSNIQPHHVASAVVDTAHQLAEICLSEGDTAGARWAVERAWTADPARLDDHLWIDAMRAAHADGRTAELRALFDDLIRTREVEVPEDLTVDTYAAIHGMLGDLLRTG